MDILPLPEINDAILTPTLIETPTPSTPPVKLPSFPTLDEEQKKTIEASFKSQTSLKSLLSRTIIF